MRFSLAIAFCCAWGVSQAQDATARQGDFHLGRVLLRPSGFFDVIAEGRSETTGDTISTRFSFIPLTENTPSETLWSFSHSRIALHGETPLAAGILTGYLEADFLTPKGDAPWRWRQYWGEYKQGKWSIMAGHGWSLLRPNRRGLTSETALMNTMVIEPAYHVGLIGVRRRQVRLTRELPHGMEAAIEWESGGRYLFKIVEDRKRAHLEAGVMAGTRGRRGVMLAHLVKLNSRLQLVGQQFAARGEGPEALGIVPDRVPVWSVIEGLEAPVAKSMTLFAYAGGVDGGRLRPSDNHLEAQWTVGAHRRIFANPQGTLFLSGQVSQIARQIWDGRNGHLNYWMTSVRYVYPSAP